MQVLAEIPAELRCLVARVAGRGGSGSRALTACYLRVLLYVWSQVGKKARDGPFGACFDMRQRKGRKEDRELVVYSARPGGRLWQVCMYNRIEHKQLKTRNM